MTSNHVLLAQTYISQNVASFTFSNIPQTGYTDLLIKIKNKVTLNNGGRSYWGVQFNNDNTNIYGSRWAAGYDTNGTLALGNTTGSTGTGILPSSDGDSGTYAFASNELYIPCYSDNTKTKIVHCEGVTGNTAGTQQMNVLSTGVWNATSPISVIKFFPNDGGNIVAGSSISIYGISNIGTTPVIAPKATGGDIVLNDGTYWYHAFTSTGVFTPSSNLTTTTLVVAGGGGGGSLGGGGGGAGGLIPYTSTTFNADINYSMIVGAGGTGGPAKPYGSTGVNGGNSSCTYAGGTLNAIGGGGGGGYQYVGMNGGSGGGGGATNPGGSNTSAQGNTGGSGSSSGSYISGGGGGGYTSAGTNASTNGGNGGNGWTIDSGTLLVTPSMTILAAGGGGDCFAGYTAGTANSGAGKGFANGTASSATSYGSGGGGITEPSIGASWTAAGNGAGGVIIIKYLMA